MDEFPIGNDIITLYESFKYNPNKKIKMEKILPLKISKQKSLLLLGLIRYHHIKSKSMNIFEVPYKVIEKNNQLIFDIAEFPNELLYIIYKFCK